MSLSGSILNFAAATLRVRTARPPEGSGHPRIPGDPAQSSGDMLYTVPLLHALRRHHPTAHVAVACDQAGVPIAQSCEAVSEVIVLARGWSRWYDAYRNAAALQDYDIVIAAKGWLRPAVGCADAPNQRAAADRL